MSVSTGARRGITEEGRVNDSLAKNEQDFIQRMKPFNVDAPGLGPGSSGEEISDKPSTTGDSFESLIADVTGFALEQIELAYDSVAESIDIFRDGLDTKFTSFGEMTGAITDDILDLIDGGDYSGQILKIRIPDGVTNFVINNANRAGNTGNILMSGIENLIVEGGEIIEFIFDTFTQPTAQSQLKLKSSINPITGVWRLASGASIPTAEPALNISRLSADQPTAGVIAWDLNFILGDETRIIDSATDGVFEIIDGVFSLESVLALQMIEAGAGSIARCEWQSSTTEGGVYAIIANNTTVLATYATGRPEFTTQPHASVIVDATGTSLFVRCFLTELQQGLTGGGILNLASFASIEFLTPGGGGGGAGGGVSKLDDLSDVTISPDPPTVDGLVLTWVNANQKWEAIAPGASTGATRELDNLTTTALNTDIHMNTFDIDEVDRFLFSPTATSFANPSTDIGITSNATSDMISNLPVLGNYLWTHNAETHMSLSQQSLDTVWEIQAHTDGGIPMLKTFQDDDTPTVGTRVADVNFLGRTDNVTPTFHEYAGIDVDYENVTDGSEEGSMHLLVADQGINTAYISLNNNADNKISYWRNIIMTATRDIELNGNTIFMDADLKSGWFGTSTGIVAQVNDVNMAIFNETNLTLQAGVSLTTHSVLHTPNTTTFLADGQIWYNSTEDKFKARQAGLTVDLIGGGGSVSDPLITENTVPLQTIQRRTDIVPDAEAIGDLRWEGLNSASTNKQFAIIRGGVLDNSSSDLEGFLSLGVATDNFDNVEFFIRLDGDSGGGGEDIEMLKETTFSDDVNFGLNSTIALNNSLITGNIIPSNTIFSVGTLAAPYATFHSNTLQFDADRRIALSGNNINYILDDTVGLHQFFNGDASLVDVTIGNGYLAMGASGRIRAATSTPISIRVNNTNDSIGSSGTMGLPYIASDTDNVNNAVVDGWFGASNGNIGVQFRSTANQTRLWVRANGVWFIAFTTAN